MTSLHYKMLNTYMYNGAAQLFLQEITEMVNKWNFNICDRAGLYINTSQQGKKLDHPDGRNAVTETDKTSK